MATRSILIALIAAAGSFAGNGTLMAQVPPHKPGSVCVVSANSWCWASSPGRVGERCQCRTPEGWVAGTYQ
jgi:hypothetical protein